MVLTLLIVARKTMQLERYITLRHLDAMAKVMLLTGSIVGLAYATEFFSAWYGGNVYEQFDVLQPRHRTLAWGFWIMVALQRRCRRSCSGSRRVRRSVPALFVLSIFVNVGMWFERFIIIVDVAAPQLPAVELDDVPADA